MLYLQKADGNLVSIGSPVVEFYETLVGGQHGLSVQHHFGYDNVVTFHLIDGLTAAELRLVKRKLAARMNERVPEQRGIVIFADQWLPNAVLKRERGKHVKT